MSRRPEGRPSVAWLVLGSVSSGWVSAGLPPRCAMRGTVGLASAVSSGGNKEGREEDGKFLFIMSGTLPGLSLISLQLISATPRPRAGRTPLITKEKAEVSRPSTQGNPGSLGGPFLPGALRGPWDSGAPLVGI